MMCPDEIFAAAGDHANARIAAYPRRRHNKSPVRRPRLLGAVLTHPAGSRVGKWVAQLRGSLAPETPFSPAATEIRPAILSTPAMEPVNARLRHIIRTPILPSAPTPRKTS